MLEQFLEHMVGIIIHDRSIKLVLLSLSLSQWLRGFMDLVVILIKLLLW